MADLIFNAVVKGEEKIENYKKGVKVPITADTTKAKSDIDKLKSDTEKTKPKMNLDTSQIKEAISGIRTMITGLGEIAIGGGITAGALGQLQPLYDQVGATNKQLGVFKRLTGESVPATFLDDSISKFKLTQEESVTTVNRFARLGAGAGVAKGNLAEFATTMAGLTIDLSNFSGTSLQDAENAMATFIKTGRGTALKELGINIESIKAQVEALGDGATEADRALILQNALKATPNLQGFTGTMQSAAAESDRASKTIQQGLLDAMTELRKVIDPVIIAISKWVQDNPQLVATIGAIVVGLLALSAVVGIITTVVGVFTALAGVISTVTAVVGLFNLSLLASPITWIVLGIIALVAIIALLVMNWQTVTDVMNVVWQSIVNAWNGIVSAVQGAVNAVIGFIQSNWQVIISIILGPLGIVLALIITNWEAIKGAVSAGISAVVGFFQGMGATIIGVVQGAFNGIISFINTAWNGIQTAVNNIVNGVVNLFKSITSLVGNPFEGLVKSAQNAVNSILGFFSGIGGKISDFFKGAVSGLLNNIPAPIRGALGFSGAGIAMPQYINPNQFSQPQQSQNNTRNNNMTINVRNTANVIEISKMTHLAGGAML
jgi:hypothetical protein